MVAAAAAAQLAAELAAANAEIAAVRIPAFPPRVKSLLRPAKINLISLTHLLSSPVERPSVGYSALAYPSASKAMKLVLRAINSEASRKRSTALLVITSTNNENLHCDG